MRLTKKERFAIGEQAALRLLRAIEDDTPETSADLLEWARASAHHFHEVLFAETVSHQLESLDPQRKIDVEALPTPPELSAFEPDATSVSVVPSAQMTSLKRNGWTVALAAGLASLLFLGWWRVEAAHTFRTGIGEQRSVKLADGSVMVLNTRSQAKVNFTRQSREVRLLEGEALFIAERDGARPFRVLAGGGSITALGTRFNVDQHTGRIRVSVLEGSVRVEADRPQLSSRTDQYRSALRLAAGDQALIADGRAVKAKNPDVPRAIAWRSRQLVFTQTPISEAAAEFNRYNKIQIRVAGDEVDQERIGGVFDADDIQTLLDFLAADSRFAVTREEREVVIRAR
jgi:transmembrane sensor